MRSDKNYFLFSRLTYHQKTNFPSVPRSSERVVTIVISVGHKDGFDIIGHHATPYTQYDAKQLN